MRVEGSLLIEADRVMGHLVGSEEQEGDAVPDCIRLHHINGDTVL